MTIDISATRRRQDKYDPSFIFENRPTGRHVLKDAVLLTDAQQILDVFSKLVPRARRPAYQDAVMQHLAGGRPGGGAVRAACVAAAVEDGFIPRAELEARGMTFQGRLKERTARATSPDGDDVGVW
jgi:hypothetical protein